MNLVISQSAYDVGIRAPVACRLEIVGMADAHAELATEIAGIEQLVMHHADHLLGRPEVAGYRELFARLGYDDQVPAGERLVNLIRQRGFKRHNTLIDVYNIVSARHACGIGLHNAVDIGHSLFVRRSTSGERITPLFKDKPVPVRAGDLIYTTEQPGEPAQRVVAWLGARDVDADGFRVTDGTRSLILVVLGNIRTSQEYNLSICEETHTLLRKNGVDVDVDYLNTKFE